MKKETTELRLDDINVTPEMAEAGLDALYGYRIEEPDGHEEMIEAITAAFMAMTKVRAESVR